MYEDLPVIKVRDFVIGCRYMLLIGNKEFEVVRYNKKKDRLDIGRYIIRFDDGEELSISEGGRLHAKSI